MSEWIELGKTFGVLFIILAFIGKCLWVGGGWLGREVFLPLVKSHIATMQTVQSSMVHQDRLLDQISENQEHLAETQAKLTETQVKLVERLELGSDIIREAKKKLNGGTA
jgi:hypothetical protein